MGDRDIVDRINDACVGHPAAKIAWPHRLLHDARDEIVRLRAELSEMEDRWLESEGKASGYRMELDIP